ncbi:MAG: T9SS type A sorting domain-containing protein [Candidatus Marinimicrobia bacterium]|nr:T9SS type A sorting domain-containing protein [Candidatus Neomarinimicrobiota bacterium]MCF7830287.1 T9SS type A sorting domain-containing protein [Candidatus Neomarinimicrobiota bacterium]MCF7882196.1 T9SS type A sorting domain-containing protein [Candidatus Neomarinimicrobiota bacterium]
MVKRLVVLVIFAFVATVAVKISAAEITTYMGNGADTYLTNDEQDDDTVADSSHGTETEMKFRNLPGVRLKLAYVRFDVSSLSDISVKNAKFSMNVTWFKGVSTTLGIYALMDESGDDWDEASTSYNTAPGFIPTDDPDSPTPVGYYQIEGEKLVEVAVMHYADDSLGWNTSEDSSAFDDFINSDTNGLITLCIIPNNEDDADWAISAKEDSTDGVLAPKLIYEEATSIENEGIVPAEYSLNQNYPNPFNPSTNIEFTLPEAGHTSLEVYNATGQLVETLVDGNMSQGTYTYTFNASAHPSGIYFYRLRSGDFVQMKKMMFLK